MVAKRVIEINSDESRHLRNILDEFAATTHGWFWEADADHRYTYFSPSVYDHTGVTAEWHYGKTREEIGMPDAKSAEEWQRHLDLINRHLPFSDFVFRRSGPDGIKWMRTSGRPIFDARGKFLGYRGTGADISKEMEAKNRVDQLAGAIEELKEVFVLWGADDRLVICNEKFREINFKVIETTEPGTLFADHIRAALAAGLYPNAAGREEDWFQARMRRHLEPEGAFEMERQDDRWLLLDEQKLADGSVATISTDITERKRIERKI